MPSIGTHTRLVCELPVNSVYAAVDRAQGGKLFCRLSLPSLCDGKKLAKHQVGRVRCKPPRDSRRMLGASQLAQAVSEVIRASSTLFPMERVVESIQ